MKDSRGMVKWAPYKSLTEQEIALARMKRGKEKKDRPLLSNDEAMEINEILVSYHKQEVEASFYKDGYVRTLKGIIERLDIIEGKIKINGENFLLKDLVALKNSD